jgi:hypothetical protein
MTELTIEQAQTFLKATNYYRGSVDGILGKMSKAAIWRVFREHRVVEDALEGVSTDKDKLLLAVRLTLAKLGYGADEYSLWESLRRKDDCWVNQKEVTKQFGYAGGPQCTAGVVRLPFKMKLAWNTEQTINSFRCHELVADSVNRVYKKIASAYSPEDISKHGFDMFGGCFNNRKKRGGVTLSMHAYGVAIDHDPDRNTFRATKSNAYLAQKECNVFWDIWESEGWHSLGRMYDFDWMHVQAPKP